MTDEMSASTRAALRRSIEESERLGPSVVDENAPREYRAVTGKPVIAVRTKDTVGRRMTMFIELNVSVSLDGVALAVQIASALQAHLESTIK